MFANPFKESVVHRFPCNSPPKDQKKKKKRVGPKRQPWTLMILSGRTQIRKKTYGPNATERPK
ncbi:hypothetical protein NC653_003126 [Populus alba x Populus x berolinensis]|uniref:Uncharacterized protein n=1 Tax=Populus alba x Populus x berolinensis TaxID=444605 RepID=A0AAD6WHT4_9ROSI|nr:hypothetical protein NC653_003126 [Populus alba x Populus x berolinensis]